MQIERVRDWPLKYRIFVAALLTRRHQIAMVECRPFSFIGAVAKW